MATTSLHALCDRSRRLLEQNEIERAIAVAQHILEYFPQNLEAHRILGEAYLAGRQFDQAQEAFSRVLYADPENIPALVGLGITHERQGRLDYAVGEFERAFEIKPDMPELRNQLLRLYTDAWGNEGAQLRVSRAGLARLYAKGHMLPQAIQEFRSVIDDQPGRFDARVGLAEALWRDGQQEATIEACQDVLLERNTLLKANLLLGYIKLAAGDPEGNHYWTEAQQLDPYYTVARVLFDTLPVAMEPDTSLPDWDEAGWMEQRTREEQQRRAEEERAAAAASASIDEDLSNSWMQTVEQTRPATSVGVTPGAKADDDFLASLLAFEGLSKDELANVLDQPTEATPPQEFDFEADVTPFTFDEFADESQTAEIPVDEQSAEAPVSSSAPEEDDLQPFSLAELGLSEEELAALDEAAAPPPPETAASLDDDSSLEPFSLADLGLSGDELAALDAATASPFGETTPDLEPFSLADLGLSDDELATLDDASATPPAEAPPGLEEDDSSLEPFSLADLGLSGDELAALNEVAMPASPEPPLDPHDTDLQPFSLDDLGLNEEDLGDVQPFDVSRLTESAPPPRPTSGDKPFSLRAFEWSQEDPPGASGTEGKNEGELADDLLRDLQPFSLDDLDLSASDLNSLGGLGEGSLPPSLQPFSLDDLADIAASVEQEYNSPAPMSLPDDEESHHEPTAFGWQEPTSKSSTDFLRRADDEDDIPNDRSIFARLKQRRQELPPEEEVPLPAVSLEGDDESLNFFSDDDVSLRDDEEQATTSAEFATEEPTDAEEPELTPFSLADLGVSEAEIAALSEGTEATAPSAAEEPAAAEEPELTPFSLADLGLGEAEIAALSGVAGEPAPPAAEEPELTPFSLADLGLSEAEIAALSGVAGEPAPPAAEEPAAAEEPELTPFSLADLGVSEAEIAALSGVAGEPAPPAAEEPELTPFSLADLGLSEAEIAALSGVAGEPAPPAAEEPAAAEEPELTPFSLVDLGLSEAEIAALSGTPSEAAPEEVKAVEPEITPFSLDDFGFDAETPAADVSTPEEVPSLPAESVDAAAPSSDFGDIQPFSLADLGLGEDEIGAFSLGDLSDQGDSELGLTEEELAGLDIGAFGQAISALNRTSSGGQPERPKETAPLAPEVSTGDPVIDQLISLGQRQGFVDLTDIIDVVEDPVGQPERIEEIGQALHNAGIEIRDGDEIIDMEEMGEEEEYAEAFDLTGIGDVPAAGVGDDPALMPFSLEDLGLSEEEIASLGLTESGVTPTEVTPPAASAPAPEEPVSPPAPASEPAPAEPELVPFSLADLGLTPEEIAVLEQAESGSTVPPAAEPVVESVVESVAPVVPEEKVPPPEPAVAPAEPELKPFSLADLGLTEAEIAALSSAASQAEVESGAKATSPSLEEADAFDFSVVDEQREEIPTPTKKRSEPRPEPEKPAVSPEDAGFVPEPLEQLDDIWKAADVPVEQPPAPPAPPAPAPAEPVGRGRTPRGREVPPPKPAPEPASRRSAGRSEESTPRRSAGRSEEPTPRRTAERSERVTAPTKPAPTKPAPAPRAERAAEQPRQERSGAASWHKSLETFIPTGDETLDEYLRQSQAEPENRGLQLAIARLSAQTERVELAIYQYKRLIKDKVALEQIVDDLVELIDDASDRSLLQRLHRLLGDAYSAQNRFKEAIAEYSWTFTN